MVTLRSCEDAIAVAGALLAALLIYGFGDAPPANRVIASSLAGLILGAITAIVTSSELRFDGNEITYRSLFTRSSYSLSKIDRVTTGRTWSVIPGQSIFILMRTPYPVAGEGIRIGVLSFPDAATWVNRVNAAIAIRNQRSENR